MDQVTRGERRQLFTVSAAATSYRRKILCASPYLPHQEDLYSSKEETMAPAQHRG
jgi:hypothetical protein